MSRARVTREDMDALAVHLTVDAVILGLLPPGAKIWWVPGKQGVGPSTPVTIREMDGTHSSLHVSFLPDFVSRDTTRDAYRALSATHKALAVLAGRKM